MIQLQSAPYWGESQPLSRQTDIAVFTRTHGLLCGVSFWRRAVALAVASITLRPVKDF